MPSSLQAPNECFIGIDEWTMKQQLTSLKWRVTSEGLVSLKGPTLKGNRTAEKNKQKYELTVHKKWNINYS